MELKDNEFEFNPEYGLTKKDELAVLNELTKKYGFELRQKKENFKDRYGGLKEYQKMNKIIDLLYLILEEIKNGK